MKRFLTVAAFVIFPFVLLVLGEWYASRGKLPPPTVQDLSDYLDWNPDADQFVSLPDGHLLALGPFVGLLPSGRSAHIFDDNGLLIDSSADMGDDPEFERRWRITYPLQIEDRVNAERENIR